jgi:hypothetical protein
MAGQHTYHDGDQWCVTVPELLAKTVEEGRPCC